MKFTQDFFAAIGGAEAAGVKIPKMDAEQWKTLLEKIVADLAEHKDDKIIFFWDEMPMMLENIKQDTDEKKAMEVLDVLRSLRQMYPNSLRMVYTGSIGLHHVFGELRQKGYTNAPINDMYTINVPPLSADDAARLALELLKGENLLPGDMVYRAESARDIAQAVDNVAFYIHHVVRSFVRSGDEITPTSVQTAVKKALRDPQDAWGMRHYLERIDTYYQPEHRPLAKHLLDVFAHSAHTNELLSQKEALGRLATHGKYEPETARQVLTLLLRDHYLTQAEVNDREVYAFYLPLIAKWWQMHRER